jgi:pimeloyl-ACP methyl ester carboxylesterase
MGGEDGRPGAAADGLGDPGVVREGDVAGAGRCGVAPGARHVGSRLDPGWRRFVDPAWLVGWKPMAFDLGDGFTEVVIMGEGPPLLLLPPLPGWKEAWAPVAGRLARRFRVVAPDLRERFGGPASWDALVADLDAVAGALAPGGTVLVGHSFGGALALRWALARPGLVRGLVLSSAFARVPATLAGFGARYVEQPLVLAALRTLPERAAHRLAAALARRRRWVFDPGCDPGTLGIVTHGVRTVSPALAAGRVRLALALDARSGLARLGCPALIVSGERDTPFAMRSADELASALPEAARAVSPGAGHLHPMSNAAWFAATVGDWCADLPARARGDSEPPAAGGAAGTPATGG